ncbi:MAG TPA: TetR/AcrR family transcriptional regulator [Microvirga sp.]|jgi:AcrR family transcriptional regulator|nr:TetR/AcrR family transcriptional regulator [Microvirga sp.]
MDSTVQEQRRPRQRRKEARPGELVRAGLAEFAAKGFAGTRLEDVARRAGVAKGTIYRYFTDKEALFLAAVRTEVAPVFDQITGFVNAYPGTTRDLLRLIFETIHRQLVASDLRVLIRIVIAEGERFPALTELYYAETVSKGRALLERIIERGIARGEVRAGAAADLPLVLVAPAIMAAIWRMTFDRYAPVSAEAFLEAHIDLVFNGLLTPEGRPERLRGKPEQRP